MAVEMTTEALARAKREARIVWIVLGVAAVFLGWFAFWFIRDGLPLWVLAIVGVMVVFFTLLTLGGLLPGEEETLARALEAEAGAVSARGTVRRLKRTGTRETTTQRFTHVDLDIELERNAVPELVSLSVQIEDTLLPTFATGQTVHLVYDPARPQRIAIDRRLSPLQVN